MGVHPGDSITVARDDDDDKEFRSCATPRSRVMREDRRRDKAARRQFAVTPVGRMVVIEMNRASLAPRLWPRGEQGFDRQVAAKRRRRIRSTRSPTT